MDITLLIEFILIYLIYECWKQSNTKGSKLRQADKSACNYFSDVLTPYSNRLHQNHFHLDNGMDFNCHAEKKHKLFPRLSK